MVRSDLIPVGSTATPPKVCAVSYLNTAPLIWGALHGPQKTHMALSFAVPSLCADQVAQGQADVGLVPVYEVDRLDLGWFEGLGIGSRGPVRSILLISKVNPRNIQRLATDSGSRTSVQLARIVLAERYGSTPEVFSAPPVLANMLDSADAALLIGDAALEVDPIECGFECLDLGEEWTQMTGSPMVFAVWAGRQPALTPSLGDALRDSALFGLSRLDEITASESRSRGLSRLLVEQYLTRHIHFLLGPDDMLGMQTYLQMARAINRTSVRIGEAEGSKR